MRLPEEQRSGFRQHIEERGERRRPRRPGMARKKTDDSKPKVRVIMHGWRKPSAEELGRHVFMAPPPRPAQTRATAPVPVPLIPNTDDVVH
jgi:hypothetical protein